MTLETAKIDVWDNAAKNAKSDCKRCGGTGRYQYDHNHGIICPDCCVHNMGYWQLSENYGTEVGWWCCLAGCGRTWKDKP